MRTEWVERARSGDHEAFTRLVAFDADRCFGIAYRILRDPQRAEDAVQQAFLSCWMGLPRLRDLERYDVWLTKLLVNAAYEEHRRYRRWSGRVRELRDEGRGTADPGIRAVDDRLELEGAFERLSPEHRATFVLHHHVGLPLADVAEVTGAPLGTVKSRLHYATRALRLAIDDVQASAGHEARPA